MGRSIRVVLADDHAVVREGLAAQVEAESDMTVVATAGDAETAVDLVLQHRPDVVLMDIEMPGQSCFAAARTIQAQAPETRVCFLSAHQNDQYIAQALEVRAWGFITKSESFAAVRDAIRAIADDRMQYSEKIMERLVAVGDGFELADGVRTRGSTLTAREIEVLQYLSRGLQVKEIARVMHLSPKTVDNHKSNIMAKLDIHDRVALARYAIREGLVPEESFDGRPRIWTGGPLSNGRCDSPPTAAHHEDGTAG